MSLSTQVDSQHVNRKLSSRKLRKEKPLYFLNTSVVSSSEYFRTEMDRFIIDGLDDRTTAVTMMHQAHVLVNFKNLLTDYDRYHPRQAMQPATTSN